MTSVRNKRDIALSKSGSKKNDLSSVGDILAGMKRSTKLGRQLELAQIWEHWEQLAGPRLAAHGAPYQVKDNTLRIRVDSAVWMDRYALSRWKIVGRINRMARKELVSDIFLALAPEEGEAPEPER